MLLVNSNDRVLRKKRSTRCELHFENLEDRRMMAVVAFEGDVGLDISASADMTPQGETGPSGVMMIVGDFNDDGVVDEIDISALGAGIRAGSNDPRFDLNSDGALDARDLDVMILDVVGTLYGDANLDFVVDGIDYTLWNESKFTAVADWRSGDFNQDGVVDSIDFTIWNANKFRSAWAFRETFDGNPDAPSQDLLPRHFDYVATHRTHPQEHFTIDFPAYPADHGDDCGAPMTSTDPFPQHMVNTDQTTNGDNPDDSFFICRNHMMSSMGHVSPYSVTAFWPKQEFNFADGGTLEFDVNINEGFGQRVWWEIMITPRDQLKVAAGPTDSAIDETYPEERIVLDFRELVRRVKVGSGEIAPEGWTVNQREWLEFDYAYWGDLHPGDEALTDRRIRRTMRIELEDEQITWGIEMEDGTFDEFVVDVPGGLPFDQGLVVFKTHAYTPTGHGNFDTYTFHWDNIQFDGPVVGRYDTHYADDVVYLQRNGDRPIGDSQTVNIELDEIGANPALFGQVHQPRLNQVELSINGGPTIEVNPFEASLDGCPTGEWNDWKSFRIEVDPADLVVGENTLTWTVGEAAPCADPPPFLWDGFSVKSLHLQTDAVNSAQLSSNDDRVIAESLDSVNDRPVPIASDSTSRVSSPTENSLVQIGEAQVGLVSEPRFVGPLESGPARILRRRGRYQRISFAEDAYFQEYGQRGLGEAQDVWSHARRLE